MLWRGAQKQKPRESGFGRAGFLLFIVICEIGSEEARTSGAPLPPSLRFGGQARLSSEGNTRLRGHELVFPSFADLAATDSPAA